MNKYLLAIDAGTGSIRSVLFDSDFNQIAISSREWTHKEDPKYPGAIDFDVKTNKKLLFETITEVINKSKINPKNIKAISSTSMREGFVLYNENKEEIWAVSNVDARAINEVKELKKISSSLEIDLYKRSGEMFALSAIPRLLWLKKNLPETYKSAKYFSMLNDWIVYCLTGTISVEPSNASTSGILNSMSREWDEEIIEKCNIKSEIFPPVYKSGETAGKVTPSVAKATGLSTKCVVAAGGGDVQLGCLGVGATKEGEAVLLGGSFWQLEYNTTSPSIDEKTRVRINCHAVDGIWQQELIAFFPGLVLRWFRDAFCDYEKMIAKEKNITFYEVMNEKAKDVPVGSNGILCSFSRIMNFAKWHHPSPLFTNFGIDPSVFNKAAFYRSLLENAAFVTLGHKRIIEEIFGTFPEKITFANGASVSPLWCQIVSDVLGVKVDVPVIKEATALGAAFCAGKAIGIIENFEEVKDKYVKVEKTYYPNEKNHKNYQNIFDKWIKISDNQLMLSNNNIVSNLWKAPGL